RVARRRRVSCGRFGCAEARVRERDDAFLLWRHLAAGAARELDRFGGLALRGAVAEKDLELDLAQGLVACRLVEDREERFARDEGGGVVVVGDVVRRVEDFGALCRGKSGGATTRE